jgi:hypothetical protein
VTASKTELEKSFTSSHVAQLLTSLSTSGLVYRNRYGKYSFAVPLFWHFIRRQPKEGDSVFSENLSL